jgi:hypothetical protein
MRKSRAEQDWHRALRSLGCKLRYAILAALVCIRRLSGHGQPLTDTFNEYIMLQTLILCV